MSEAPLHRLPPLNPMSDAPRDGTRIYAMTRHGEIKPFRLATSPWNNAQKWNDLTGKERPDLGVGQRPVEDAVVAAA